MTTELATQYDTSANNANKKAWAIADQFQAESGIERLETRIITRLTAHVKKVNQALKQRYDIGLDLIALRRLTSHGNWEYQVAKLGFNSRQAAQKYIDLAHGWELIKAEVEQAGIDNISMSASLERIRRLQKTGGIIESITEDIPEAGELPLTSKPQKNRDNLKVDAKRLVATANRLCSYRDIPEVLEALNRTVAIINECLAKEEVKVEE